MENDKEFYFLNKLILDFMDVCHQRNAEYCDDVMCADCPILDRNISYEIDKKYGQCFNCNGLGYRSTFTTAFTSTTKKCNVCGGTGEIIYSMER